MLTALDRGASLDECVDGWIELPPTPGLVLLDGPSPNRGGEDHVHAFALGHAFDPRWGELTALRERWFDLATATPWSCLSLFTQHGYGFLPDDRWLTFLERVTAFWPELDTVGARYSEGLPEGSSLWSLPTNVHTALAREGLPLARLEQPLGPRGLAGLIRETAGWRIRDELAAGRVDAAAHILGSLGPQALVWVAHHLVAAGHVERAIEVVREVSARGDPGGHLAEWVAEHEPSLATARAAFAAAPSATSWRRLEAWNPDEAEQAVVQLRDAGQFEQVLEIRLAAGDAAGALAAWDEAAARGRAPFEAAETVADLIAATQPSRAAELLLMNAEMFAQGSKRTYSTAADLVRRAHEVLVAAGRTADAAAMIAKFRRTYARRRLLLAALDAAGI